MKLLFLILLIILYVNCDVVENNQEKQEDFNTLKVKLEAEKKELSSIKDSTDKHEENQENLEQHEEIVENLLKKIKKEKKKEKKIKKASKRKRRQQERKEPKKLKREIRKKYKKTFIQDVERHFDFWYDFFQDLWTKNGYNYDQNE